MWLLREVSAPYLRRHLPRTALTVASIALGVAAIVATVTLTQSVLKSFERTVRATAGQADLQVTNGGIGVPEDLVAVVTGAQGVAAASPFVEGLLPLAHDRRRMLSIFGFDLLADEESLSRIPPSAFHIPDRDDFILNDDSVALATPYAKESGKQIGDTIDVIGPFGARALTVRALVDAVGPVALFGADVALMDLPAAQQLLGKERRVDHIDIVLAQQADIARVETAIRDAIQGTALVHRVADQGSGARDLLSSLRVVLYLAGALAVIVGGFIIYHTVEVSLAQRRSDVGLLHALGVSREGLIRWVLLEGLMLALLGCFWGLGMGIALAHLSIAIFGAAATAWTIIAPPTVAVSPAVLLSGVAIGVTTTLLASLLAARSLFIGSTAALLRFTTHSLTQHRRAATMLWWSAGFLLVSALLIAAAPPTLPFIQLVAFILSVNCMILVGFGLIAPLPAKLLGWMGTRLGDRMSSMALTLSGARFERNPWAAIAATAAIVMAFGWTLANASLVRSFKDSFMEWVNESYYSDLTVTAEGSMASILTARPFSDEVISEVRGIEGVTRIQGLRRVEIEHEDRPAMLIAFDRDPEGLPVRGHEWKSIEQAFWDGGTALIGEGLAHRTGLGTGDSVSFHSPTGTIRLPIAAVFRDVFGGDIGAFAISRELYKARWKDPLIDRIRVWTSTEPEDVAAEINARYGRRYGLQALIHARALQTNVDMIENAFLLAYALVFVCLVTSSIGVFLFLWSAILDRSREYRTLRAVGVSPWQLVSAVSAEGGIIGLAGVLMGLVGGTAISLVIVLQSVPMVNGLHFDYSFPTAIAVATAIGGVVIPAGVGLIPGRTAARNSLASKTGDE